MGPGSKKDKFYFGGKLSRNRGWKNMFPATVLKVELVKSGAVRIRAGGRPHV